MMHFDESGKYMRSKEMHNNNLRVKTDHVSKYSNGACKKLCLQYLAQKPSGGSRYENGQRRCLVCEQYITVEGTKDEKGLFCKCCHYRVRSKPRNRIYKEKLRNKQENKPEIDVTDDIQAANYVDDHKFSSNTGSDIETNGDYSNIDDDPVDKVLDTVPMNDDYSNEKKSTPIYEDIDESVKTFYEFKDFLDSIKLQANYQLVMLKELVEYGENHKGEIAESLAYFNNKDTTNLNAVKYYFDVPVYDVLLNHGFVISTGYKYNRFPIYKLNVQLNGSQKFGVLELIENKLNKYNQLNEIPENEFPNSDNRGSIVWNSRDTLEKFKQIDPELSSTIWMEQQEKIAKDTSEGVIGKIYRNLTRKIHATPSKWIWSVTPENWEILKSQNVWGSRIAKERIGEKVKPGDQVAFYVIGTSSFKGIFEFVGDWYDSPGKTWDDDLRPDGSLIYISQIQIKPIQLGSVKIHNLHEKLELFVDKSQSNRNLVLQGGNGYPSNNSRPLSEDDFAMIRSELSIVETIQTNEKLEESDSISDVADTKIFNFDDGKVNIQNCKILSTDTIKKDQILTNDEIVKLFKVGNMGGIRYTKYNNVIVLLSTHSDDDDDDSIHLNSGFVFYTGEGQGDQEIKNGNEKILNSQKTPMVFFKEVYQEPGSRPRGALDNKYKFIGVVKYHKYNWATEKGRKVIKFVLEIVS